MTLDDVLLRSRGALDLMVGRRAEGWRRLDLSPDGFWDSFAAIPATLPALFVISLAHANWLIGQGVDAGAAGASAGLVAAEVANWLVTIAAVVLAARAVVPGRVTPLVVALNWSSVPFAYARAVPAALSLLTGMGEGIALLMLVVTLASLVLYWRLLAAASEAGALVTTAFYGGTIALGYALMGGAQSLLGLDPAG